MPWLWSNIVDKLQDLLRAHMTRCAERTVAKMSSEKEYYKISDLEDEVLTLRAQVQILQNWVARAKSLGFDPDRPRDRPGSGHGGLA